MTAISLLVQRNRASLLTDAAYYDEVGTVHAIGSKVALAPPGFRMAVAVAGHAFAPIVRDALATASTQTEALSWLPSIAAAIKTNTQAKRPTQSGDLQLFAVLWSDRTDEPEGWVISTSEAYFGPSYQPGRLVCVDQVCSPPIQETPFDLNIFDPQRDGRAVLVAQRAKPDERDGAFCVGGFGELTTVTRTGVRQKRLVRWPDRVGEVISV